MMIPAISMTPPWPAETDLAPEDKRRRRRTRQLCLFIPCLLSQFQTEAQGDSQELLGSSAPSSTCFTNANLLLFGAFGRVRCLGEKISGKDLCSYLYYSQRGQ
jgi:hypothetical protein